MGLVIFLVVMAVLIGATWFVDHTLHEAGRAKDRW